MIYIFLAQMQNMVGKFNFAWTSVMGRAGRVALRPLYDFAARLKGVKVDPCTRGALSRRLQISPSLSQRMIKPVGGRADGRTFSDTSTTDGGLAAVAWLEGDFVAPIKSPAVTNENFGLELFQMVAAVFALGSRIGG